MGILQYAYRFYRREGMKSTLVAAVEHATMHVLRLLLIARWRLQGRATIQVMDSPIRLYATKSYERRAIWWLQHNEGDHLEELIATIGPDDVFYDVGANIGFYTCPVAVLTDAEVHAFEPQPGNVDRIEENLALNGSRGAVHEIAVDDRNGETTFATSLPDEPGFGHGVITRSERPDEAAEEITVQQRVIDDMVEAGDIPAPTVVKIDVEGSESRVLAGMRTHLESGSIHTILLEIHNPSPHRLSVEDFGSSEEAILATLRDLGFTIDSKNPGAREYYVVARREGSRVERTHPS